MLTRGVHHISFTVRDLDRSRAFYEGLLGLESIPRPEIGLPGIWYRAGSSEVHLIAWSPGDSEGEPTPRLTPLANHSAFAIEDYDTTVALLKGKGLEVFETSSEQGQLWVHDPDGNVIEFITTA